MSSDITPSKQVGVDPTGHRRVAASGSTDGDPAHDFLPRDEIAQRFAFSTRLRSLRQKLRMSQTEFSDQHKIPLGALQMWENAEALPGEADLALIRALEARHPDV